MPSPGKKYNVNADGADVKMKPAWCGYRVVIIFGTVVSILIYTVGAILTGVSYRTYDRGVNCTLPYYAYSMGSVIKTTSLFGYNTPLVVVGPVLMGVGGTIIGVLLLQWCFCRPALTNTYML
ncbi:uncharacterized protein LOC108678985 [Hyalella azteca]|uniref:Uncharacterized protein LOC108678985 n=1 Tax=Hyalella azteca TaxID=294128 RepID=A0A8B7PB79_HYAAZ|nr:uncharacterized protein LOC108678985 [Hyalella azteca]XP_018022973.1 uncharacterized protein LOC108678985 [Hyalella azteca]